MHERPLEERAAFLKAVCARRETLRSGTESLIAGPPSTELSVDRASVDAMPQTETDATNRSLIGRRLGVYQC